MPSGPFGGYLAPSPDYPNLPARSTTRRLTLSCYCDSGTTQARLPPSWPEGLVPSGTCCPSAAQPLKKEALVPTASKPWAIFLGSWATLPQPAKSLQRVVPPKPPTSRRREDRRCVGSGSSATAESAEPDISLEPALAALPALTCAESPSRPDPGNRSVQLQLPSTGSNRLLTFEHDRNEVQGSPLRRRHGQ